MIETRARIHQFAGKVALRIGDGPTQYLNWYLAEQLAQQLAIAAKATQEPRDYPANEIDIQEL